MAEAGQRSSAIARLGANLVALGSVLTGKSLIACGLRRRPEGWRRTLGVLLRAEPTRFAMSAFGLRAPEGDAVSALQRYLSSQPDAHFRLEWHDAVTVRTRTAWVDVVRLRFASNGDLHDLEPHFANAPPVNIDHAQ